MYTHTRAYINVYEYIYTDTYAYTYICTLTYMRMHDTVHTLKH